MAKKVNEVEKIEKTKKKKMTTAQKNRLVMKVVGWFMALIMIVGTLMSIFGMLIYYK